MAREKFNNIVGSGILAKVLGKSQRQIQNYAADGILSVTEENKNLKFDLFQVVPEFISYKENEFKENSTETEIANQEKRKAKAEADLKTHKAKMAKLQLSEMEGEMHRSEDVEKMTSQLVIEVKNRLLSLPGKLAVDLSRIDDPAQIASIIKRSVFEILEELSRFEYNPEEYEKLVRGRVGWRESNNDSATDNQTE